MTINQTTMQQLEHLDFDPVIPCEMGVLGGDRCGKRALGAVAQFEHELTLHLDRQGMGGKTIIMCEDCLSACRQWQDSLSSTCACGIALTGEWVWRVVQEVGAA